MPAGRPSARALVIVRKFRLAVVWGLIGLLWWCLLTALERQLQYAEEQGTRLVLAQLRAALVVKGAETMLTQPERLAGLSGGNPFDWLQAPWPAYRGDCGNAVPEPGDWCFQPGSRESSETTKKGWLLYTPRQPVTVDGNLLPADRPVAWQVTTTFVDRNGNRRREAGERLTGLALEPVPMAMTGVDGPGARP
ncbi:hypothetical protein [Marinobacter lutaoensis]|uniref:Uncharacterized protein n=1 Tax=Marinobacter lutaoensis TaxID=135739 RepID=A0A1V2DW65_9GAMM|nr:hypothetical protein [Marinobacter lutaoensis]ONF44636.1 hypothetical protein BTO32_04100 [Marinobacter lutaoensis]